MKSIGLLSEKVKARFWDKVNKADGCWEWKGGVDRDGYGRLRVRTPDGGHKTFLVHRIAWELSFGTIKDGLWVLHHCDNRKCCRPEHLHLGTHQDNMDEMRCRKRAATGDRNGSCLHPERLKRGHDTAAHLQPEIRLGERNGRAKLTEADVLAIRQQFRPRKMTAPMLARKYGVDESTIQRVVYKLGWKHVAP